MKISLSWAQHYSNVDLASLPTDQLVKLASERLGGVEGYEDLAERYEDIVVGKVVSCNKHPNADKLSVCDVDVGQSELVQVVCGAPNVREGLLVAWIPPGHAVPATLGNKEPFVLEAREIRGEMSNGMLASPHELGLNDNHEGILEIDQEVKPGTPFKKLYGLDDVVIDIENKMFTHRPDCFGILGVARELAGIQHKAFISPEWYTSTTMETVSHDPNLVVDNQIPELCPRYIAVVLDDIQVKPSPLWLQAYLKRVGIRPINNVVDITNYMMVLTAQPLHAFDFDKVAQNGVANIVVRRPLNDEAMKLLDGKEITPHKDAILICNQDKPIALGGVMGGGNSEVDASTTRVVLEVATFDMYNIRRTSMTHGIFTDAVTRFNKGQPAAQILPVLHEAVDMFKKLTGAKVASNVVDSSPGGTAQRQVEVSVGFINSRLGSSFAAEQVAELLKNVEFNVEIHGSTLMVVVPFWRTDIEIPEDVVEEVGRLYGFNELPIELPTRSIKPIAPTQQSLLRQAIRQSLSRAGANETLTYSFVHGDLLTKAGQDVNHAYKIKNALSPDLQHYRLSLVPSLLDKVHPNVKAGYDRFALFEIGKAHDQREKDAEGLPREFERLAFVYADSHGSSRSAPYFEAKHHLAYVLDSLGVDGVKWTKLSEFDFTGHVATEASAVPFHSDRAAVLTLGDRIAGVVGEFAPSVRSAFKLPAAAAGFEISLLALLERSGKPQHYAPLSRFPSVVQDISLRVTAETSYQHVYDALTMAVGTVVPKDIQQNITPLDIYQGSDTDHKNITFRVQFVSFARTLQAEAVNKLLDEAAASLKQSINAERI